MTIRRQLRDKVFARDRGVCKSCNCDTEKLRQALDFARKALVAKHGWKEGVKQWNERVKAMGFKPGQALWHDDHIIPVNHADEEGMVEWRNPDTGKLERIDVNDLRNQQTLCVPCHNPKTRTQAGQDAKVERQHKKSKPKPAPVKDWSRKLKKPNVQIPGVNAPVYNTIGE